MGVDTNYYNYSYKETLKDPIKDLKDFIVKGLTSLETEVCETMVCVYDIYVHTYKNYPRMCIQACI